MVRLTIHIFFCILLFGASPYAFSQQPYYYRITVEDGLPSNEVYQVIQDTFGYIWIGCDAGLYRYDGFRFKSYSNPAQNGRSISSLQPDAKGRIWCKNFAGQIYHTEGDSLYIVCDFAGQQINDIQYTVDRENRVWVCKGNRIMRYDEWGENPDTIHLAPEINLASEIKYFNGEIYINSHRKGIYRLDISNGKVSALILDSNLFGRTVFLEWKNRLVCLTESSDHKEHNAYILYRDSAERVRKLLAGPENSRLFAIRPDRADNLWLCTINGAGISQNSAGEISRDVSILQGEQISYMLHDRENNFWFSTLDNGLIIIPSMEVVQYSRENTALPENNITEISLVENGKVLAGTFNGLAVEIDPQRKTLEKIWESPGASYYSIKKILETTNRYIISRGITQMVEKPGHNISRIAGINIRDMVWTKDTLYALFSESFGAIPKNRMEDYANPEAISILRKESGRAIESDTGTGEIFIAFYDGSYCYRNGTFNEILYKGNKLYASDLFFHDGILWIASISDGIYGYRNGEIFIHYDQSSGLKEEAIRKLTAYKHYLLAATSGYLHVINRETGKITWYGIYSGISPQDINAMTCTGNTIYLATKKGIIVFPLELPAENLVQPNIAITKVLYNDELLDINTQVSLPYSHKNLYIEFSATAFRSRGQFRYEYRLMGFDSTWTSVPGTINSVIYSSLPPGDYIFEVRAVNEYGVKSSYTATIPVSVASPIYQRWWFFLLAAAILISVAAIVFYLRLRYLHKKSEAEKKLATSQLTALKAQMNPHFMYNALNSIQHLVLKQDVENSYHYLGMFSDLTRKVLDASGNDQVLLSEETEMLRLYLDLEKLRFGDEFQYEIETDPQIVKEETYIPSMIIQPYVENAIKHGLLHKHGAKRLKISFRREEKYLLCMIEDNGIGRKKAAEIKARTSRKSFATAAIEKRVHLLNQFYHNRITVQTFDPEDPGGTRVEIRIEKRD